MQRDSASENLQIIRTLMERSALYRRALAPVMGTLGATGIAAAVAGCYLRFQSPRSLAVFWMAASAVCLVEAFVLVRRQAIKEAEPFWSPPTRRVARAMAPAFFAGFGAGLAYLIFEPRLLPAPWLLVPAWMLFYGCGLHAAGFFLPRGFRLLGWAFVIFGVAAGIGGLACSQHPSLGLANLAMGLVFGGSHWACGIYLYFSEKRRSQP